MRHAVVCVLILACAATAQEVSAEKLRAHVEKLASAEFGGRRGKGARLAEAYIQKLFVAAGLKTHIQVLPGSGEPVRNVVGVLAAGNEPTAEHVILSAHYDHLGRLGGFVFPGASDNAAGVAALLEIARVLKPAEGRLKRDVIFVAFDQEEIGLVGSDAYAQKPVRPLKDCAAFLTFDILGRDLAGVTTGLLFCTGTEKSEGLIELVKASKKPEGLQVVFSGADIVGARSDFMAFMERKVPFLFFSTGENVDYHRPTDTPEKMNWPKLHRETLTILDVCRRVIEAPRAKFLEEPAARVDEPATLAIAIGQLLEKGKALGLSNFELGMGKTFQNDLLRMKEKGVMTSAERKRLVMFCRQLIKMLQKKR